MSDQKDWIAVLGGATRYNDAQIVAAYQIGREIARKGKNVVTGGTTGTPYAAAIGAKQVGATVIGISPASGFEEHVVVYKKPLDYVDFMAYTGMGVVGRSAILMRSAYGAIFIGGEAGTLHEFSTGWMCGNNVLGVLQGVGGISEHIEGILSKFETSWGSKVIFDTDPRNLVQKVCESVDQLYLAKIARLPCEEIGSDVRDSIRRFLDEETTK